MPMQQLGGTDGSSSPEYTATSMEPGSPEGSTSSGRARQRLKPWLEAQINSGRFPGLAWVDKKQRTFRITWKHGGRADWSEQDALIFKEWAIHTGRYREGTDQPDWPSWKTRLRCALNKLPDIEELKEESCYDEPNPYRVYKFVDRRGRDKGSGSSSPPQQCAHTPPSVSEDSCSFSCPPPLSQPPHRPSVIQPNIPNIITESQALDASTHRHEGSADAQVSSLGSDLAEVSINDLLPIADNSMLLTNISVDSSINSCPPEPMDTDSLKGAAYHQLSQHVKAEPVEKPDPLYYQTPINDHELTLTIRYRTRIIKQETVTSPHGCRVFYSSAHITYNYWNTDLLGDQQAQQVLVPYRQGDLEDRQDNLTTTLLDAMELGINIYVDKGSIYVVRRCKTSIFAAPPNKAVKQTIKIERKHPAVKIFDYSNDFFPAFLRYQQGEGPRPSPQVIIAFGQNFHPDSEPYTNLLLSVTVCHPQANHLLAQHMPDMPVEISRSNEYEQQLDLVRANPNHAVPATQSALSREPLLYAASSTN